MEWFCRYRPLPERLFQAASEAHPLIATRQDLFDEVTSQSAVLDSFVDSQSARCFDLFLGYEDPPKASSRHAAEGWRCFLLQARGEDLESIGVLERLLRNSHSQAHAEIAAALWDRC